MLKNKEFILLGLMATGVYCADKLAPAAGAVVAADDTQGVDKETCVICSDALDAKPIMTGICGTPEARHKFHTTCIRRTFKYREHQNIRAAAAGENEVVINECPLCRDSFLSDLVQFSAEFDLLEQVFLNAAKNNDLKGLQKCINAGVDINAFDQYGHTALILASKKNHIKIVKLLISINDTNVNAQCNKGRTALYRACKSGYIDIVKLLLTMSELKLNLKDKLGYTALTITYEPEIAELLLSIHAVNVNIPNNLGETALIRFCQEGWNNHKITQMLLGKPELDVNAQDDDGKTALIHACENDDEKNVKLLLEHPDIDLNVEDNDGETALDKAKENGNTEIVKMLQDAAFRKIMLSLFGD